MLLKKIINFDLYLFDSACRLTWPDSPTFCQWAGVELTAESRQMLVVPEGCAHGFQTLLDDTEVYYLVSARYSPEGENGVRWDDPAFNIQWPLPVSQISAKDAGYPNFKS